ncbi:peptidoglycan-binding protein [Flindersiella endophytica]
MADMLANQEDIATKEELAELDVLVIDEDDSLADADPDPVSKLGLLGGPKSVSHVHASNLLKLAKKQVGLGPKKFHDFYGVKTAWCAIFTMWVAHNAGDRSLVPWSARCSVQVKEWKARGRWHEATADPKVGDLFYIAGGPHGVQHVGFVAQVGEDGKFWTVEGNYDNRVARVARNWKTKKKNKTVAGFGRPDYAGSAASGDFAPFPGEAFFKSKPRSALITRMGRRLVAEKCSAFEVGPGPQWGEADRKSYALFQRKLGFNGADADGFPGPASWRKLKVPKV